MARISDTRSQNSSSYVVVRAHARVSSRSRSRQPRMLSGSATIEALANPDVEGPSRFALLDRSWLRPPANRND